MTVISESNSADTVQTRETELKLYKATPRVSGTPWLLVAKSLPEAVKLLKESAPQFMVEEVRQYVKTMRGTGRGYYVCVPCKTCPYQYGECRKPADGECAVKIGAPDMTEWIKRASEAHMCKWVGVALSKTDHAMGQKWQKTEDAIIENSRQ